MRLIGITLLIILFSCQQKPKKIFWIDKNVNNKSDLLFIAESTNVKTIEPDSIRIYLEKDEVIETRILESNLYFGDTILPKTPEFKNFGEIYKNERFTLNVIFRDGNDSLGRDYKFILRTYQDDMKIIDSYVLANWIKRDEEYCFGSIDENLIIKKFCEGSPNVEKHRLSKSGEFIRIED